MKQKTKKASILAFTLIMMGILLAAGLSLMGATIVDQKVALESGNSIQALQNAESGTEVAVSVLSGNFATDPNKDQLSEVFQDHGFICSGNEVIESDYTLTFYDKDENQLDCTDDIADAESVKSVGTNQNTTRAVQVALAATPAGVVYEQTCPWRYDYREGIVNDGKADNWGCSDGQVPTCDSGDTQVGDLRHEPTSVACSSASGRCSFDGASGHPVVVGHTIRTCVTD